jgi:nucleotide sugar dehydrogenase
MTVVGIIGLGYVGREVAKLAVNRGYDVVAFDIDEEVLTGLREGSLIEGVDPVDVDVVTDGATVGALADVVVLAVPTPLDSSYSVDLNPLVDATEAVAAGIVNNDSKPLVVVESTVPPRTTETVVAKGIEATGHVVGEDCYLAHAPERIDPGNEEWSLERLPRVVGSMTDEGREVATAFFEEFLNAEVHSVSSPAEAEAAKIIENAYRDINIAFVNEIALSLEGLNIDAPSALDAAATKPFGFQRFNPGAGVGGHCIPVDPYLLIDSANRSESKFDHRLLKIARSVNDRMPVHVANRTVRALNDVRIPPYEARVLVLGKTFKPGVTDIRNSPYFRIVAELEEYDCRVETYDPLLPEDSTVTSPYVDADAVVLVTAHKELVNIDPARLAENGVSVVVDGRNAFDQSAIEREGLIYRGVGRD